ncbi:glycosyltransferase family 2 protein [Geobacter pelophilus]|uniref:Glycosyltransferase family 2 protein n=1 Tax=Geoanaerobacter pelophilus TaxID=60036 RepID=A0AAW4L3U6_9BACT|nr:glycosyltransferase family 2 protein [Geoanaerobacter pelophilus]
MAESRKLSVVIIALNESRRIAGCLESVQWADDIVVVDSGSTDGTVELARNYGARVHDVPWIGFGPQKQAAVNLAAYDMVFNIDCDERVTPELAEEIKQILASDEKKAAYSVPRRTFLGLNEIRHCGWYPDRTVRLFDRRMASFSSELVHEKVVVNGETGICHGELLHYSFDGFSDLIVKMNRYTDIGAAQLLARGKKSCFSQVVFRPLYAFSKTFFLQKGFLDGFAGFAVAVSNAVSVFYKYAKLRELQHAKSEKNREAS